MPRILSSAGLPNLELSHDDEIRLRTVVGVVEAEAVAHYEDYLFRCKRSVDKTQWKLLHHSGALDVFQERDAKSDDMGFMSSAPVVSTAHGPHATMVSESKVGRILVVGTVPGSLEDAMYASSFHNTASLRIVQAYQRDFLSDSVVMDKIEGATSTDPFHFLGVTWHLRPHKLLSIVAKNSDCLLVQAVHLSTLSTGEPIGIAIRHSIEHKDLPELTDFATHRVNLSGATIFRQVDLENMEIYNVELLDAKNNAARDVASSLVDISTTGFKKKLHWLMRLSHREKKLDSAGDEEPCNDSCELCSRTTSGLFAASGRSCQICFKHACSRCTIVHDIAIDASSSRVVTKPFRFCVECVLHSKALETINVATDEANSRGGDSIAILGSVSTASHSSSER